MHSFSLIHSQKLMILLHFTYMVCTHSTKVAQYGRCVAHNFKNAIIMIPQAHDSCMKHVGTNLLFIYKQWMENGIRSGFRRTICILVWLIKRIYIHVHMPHMWANYLPKNERDANFPQTYCNEQNTRYYEKTVMHIVHRAVASGCHEYPV